MRASEITETISYINQLISGTGSQSLSWVLANPSTYILSSLKGRIILQSTKVPEMHPSGVKMVDRYQLRVSDLANNIKLTVDGVDDEQINRKLGELYSVIEAAISRAGLDFFKSLLPPTS